MKNALIAVIIAVLGATGQAALAQTLNESPNPAWRNAPEGTAVHSGRDSLKYKPAYEVEQPTYISGS
jgi:hypothetical protein